MSVDNVTTEQSVTITCTQENFARGVQTVSRVATTKSSLPILANIHVIALKGQLQLAATDLEIGVTTQIGAKVDNTGAVTLPARLLVDFITNNTDETVTLVVSGADAELISDRYHAVIKGMDATEFPLIPPPGKQETTTVPAGQLKTALSDVLFAAAIDDARPVLNGVLCRFSGTALTVVATDSYRLAERSLTLSKKIGTDSQVIVPSRSVAEIIRILPDSEENVRVSATQSQLSFEFENTVVVSRLVEGTYPDYKQIIPDQATTTVTAKRDECIAAVRMASLFARDVAHHVRFTLSPDSTEPISIHAFSSSIGSNKAAVAGDASGEALEIAFNAKFLLDALNNTRGEIVTLQFQGQDRPVVIRSTDDTEYLNLVMPLRLDA